ncbi:GA module-containing protein [Dolosigranulum pigrum]|uniref:Protein G-related albumin-binding (GA) module domain-containing protein n=1 Tax=Dolosigranulum pigrum TaxID=29394 RepID=A0A516GHQ4_9LACT|nr:GA module-containing protein [Dolosigranulum pigrum]QDO91038.1 hypothetical protein FNV33_02855 [Dolosigranulum pigrum]
MATLDNDVEVAELASEAVTNITLMGMDDETAKATAKDTIAALSTLTPEQQDQLSQAIDKATNNKEIAGFYNKQKHKRKRTTSKV